MFSRKVSASHVVCCIILTVSLPSAGIPTMPSSQVDMRAQRKKGKTNKGGGTSIDKYVRWVPASKSYLC